MADGNAVYIATTVRFETVNCCTCGVTFAVSWSMRSNWLRDKTKFYCPNGHSQSYKESEANLLRRQLEAAIRENDAARREAFNLRTNAADLARALKKVRNAAARLKSKRVMIAKTAAAARWRRT